MNMLHKRLAVSDSSDSTVR